MYEGGVKYELEAFFHYGISDVTNIIEKSIYTGDYI